MVTCTYYYNRVSDNKLSKSENIRMEIDKFLALLKEFKKKKVDIVDAHIENSKLDCNKLLQLLIL